MPWSVAEYRATKVSATALRIPAKASREYERACTALTKRAFAQAEQHARGAIAQFRDYAAAWTLLGIILEDQHERQDAHDACRNAIAADATYQPGYLCQALLSARDQDWEQVLTVTEVARGLNTGGDGYVYFYRGVAYLQMNDLAKAKENALRADAINVKRNAIPLDFLLAQVYAADGDMESAAVKLKDILKRHSGGPEEDAAKQFLARIEAQAAVTQN